MRRFGRLGQRDCSSQRMIDVHARFEERVQFGKLMGEVRLLCLVVKPLKRARRQRQAARAADPYKLTLQLNYPAAGFNSGFELAARKGRVVGAMHEAMHDAMHEAKGVSRG